MMTALTACKGDAPPRVASTGEAFPFLPLPPNASVMSRAGSPNALQITFMSSATSAEVLDYYRKSLPEQGWSLESDVQDAAGASALYALKEGHPIWIRISQRPGMPGSVVEVAGAVVERSSPGP